MSSYVYEPDGKGGFIVGFYSPEGRWMKESDHEHKSAAADRVHWLNGGSTKVLFEAVDMLDRMAERYAVDQMKIPAEHAESSGEVVMGVDIAKPGSDKTVAMVRDSDGNVTLISDVTIKSIVNRVVELALKRMPDGPEMLAKIEANKGKPEFPKFTVSTEASRAQEALERQKLVTKFDELQASNSQT